MKQSSSGLNSNVSLEVLHYDGHSPILRFSGELETALGY